MKKIWRWICETAWIQPLLIVGLIFAVVFSIPSISSWINDLSKSQSHYDFYNDNDISSQDLLKSYIDNGYSDLADEEGNFFLVFIKSGCPSCEEDEAAFKDFMKKGGWDDGKGNKVKPEVHFLYVNYDKDSSSKKEKAKAEEFEKLETETNLWEDSIGAYLTACDSGYAGVSTKSDEVDNYFTNNEYPTPMIAYFSKDESQKIVMKEAIMGIPSEKTTSQKVEYLRDFYYHQGQFE